MANSRQSRETAPSSGPVARAKWDLASPAKQHEADGPNHRPSASTASRLQAGRWMQLRRLPGATSTCRAGGGAAGDGGAA
jgi:hypothetical protein